nr:B12-binding domain-containing radical SAM protein [Candidatus Omnitrophota bacterium]
LRILRAHLQAFSPQIICTTAVASQNSFIERIALAVKKEWPDKYLVSGGVHATLRPEETIAGPFDAICLGEGEYPLLELVGQIAKGTTPSQVPNFWIKHANRTIEKNPPRPFLKDLDSLPFPDRSIWDPWVQEEPGGELSVLLGRGCPYDCTYCCNHALKKSAPGKYVRLRTPGNIVRELASLLAADPQRARIYYEIDTIASDPAWFEEFCEQLQAFNKGLRHRIAYGCNLRVTPLTKDPAIFDRLKKAGFDTINIGLESGSERVRRAVLGRDGSNQDLLDAAGMARAFGLNVRVYNMIGIPGESVQEHGETVAINRQLQPDRHYTSIFSPYPGTALYDLCFQKGYLKNPLNVLWERRQALLDLPGFTRSQIQKAYTWFHYRVYKGHRPLWKLWLQTLAVKLRSDERMYPLFQRIFQWPPLARLHRDLIEN